MILTNAGRGPWLRGDSALGHWYNKLHSTIWKKKKKNLVFLSLISHRGPTTLSTQSTNTKFFPNWKFNHGHFIAMGASLVLKLVKNLPAMQETPVFSYLLGKIPWRRDRLPTPIFLGFPGGSAGKESPCNTGDLSLIPGLGRSPGEGKGYPL